MPRPESEFPTISDFKSLLEDLIEKGFGDLPCQVLIVPDSTLQALARHGGNTDKPAVMIDWQVSKERMAVSLMTTERWRGDDGMNLSQN